MIQNYLLPEANTGNDREEIQRVIDKAYKENTNVLIPKGEWRLDASLLIYENLHIHLNGSHLIMDNEADENKCIFRNSISHEIFGMTRVATQEGITITAENGAVIEGGSVLFRNVAKFTLEGIEFRNCSDFALRLVFSHAGRVKNLSFTGCRGAIDVCAGTQDCIFTDLSGDVKEDFICFDDSKCHEMGVWYNMGSLSIVGYELKNHIVRNVKCDASGEIIKISGSSCQNIICV